MKKITCQDIKAINSKIHEHAEKCKNDLLSVLCADIKAELLKSSKPTQVTICKPAVDKVFYYSSISLWNSWSDFTPSFPPSSFTLRMPSVVAMAAAMVVMYGILPFTAALRI